MTLLARNQRGYITLTELISKAYQEGQHLGVPMVRRDWLRQNHQGLIVLSGAMEGDVGQALLAGKMELAKQRAQDWGELFSRQLLFGIATYRQTGRIALSQRSG